MKIVVIRKDSLSAIPPLISVALIMADLGHQVHILTSEVSDTIAVQLKEKGISYQELNYSSYSNKLGMLVSYLRYRFAAKRALKKLNFDLLWVEDAHTMTILGSIIKKYRYILQVSELYDTIPYLFYGIRRLIQGAELVFLPEYNRCILYQVWFGLKKRPVLLPNKPYFVPSKTMLNNIKVKYLNYLDLMKNKKVILYQGRIHPERTIETFIKAAALLGDEWLFVVMGYDQFGLIDRYKTLNHNLLHIDFIPAPNYLAITSETYIGILSYSPMELNTAFCAPNKIYEYGAFNIPMIGNNIPGLKVLEQKGAGILVNEDDINEIKESYLKIDVNHNYYAINAKKLFDETDNVETIKQNLEILQPK